MSKYIKVKALSKDGTVEGAHCPLVNPKQEKFLKNTFNFLVRDEQIIEFEISEEFTCIETKDNCIYCPFCKWNKED